MRGRKFSSLLALKAFDEDRSRMFRNLLLVIEARKLIIIVVQLTCQSVSDLSAKFSSGNSDDYVIIISVRVSVLLYLFSSSRYFKVSIPLSLG